MPPAHEQTTAPAPVPCVVWLVWEHDGSELTETEAIGWTRTAVLVRVYDRVVVPVSRALERRLTPPFGQSVLGVATVPDGVS